MCRGYAIDYETTRQDQGRRYEGPETEFGFTESRVAVREEERESIVEWASKIRPRQADRINVCIINGTNRGESRNDRAGE